MSAFTSPFKFLDSYQREDLDIFFGRERETENLYDAISGVKHLLVYGPSGSGKTSLIECGLRNRFSDADWYALSIRRGGNMTASVFARVNEALRHKIKLNPDTKLPTDQDIDFGQAIEQLFDERYKPVYLLFDQFEELLISGDDAEKREFFTRLDRLIRYKVPCRVLLVMREEFIGHLSEFEPLCPSIFQHRFRLEKMGRKGVHEVIEQILAAPHYAAAFTAPQPKALADKILTKLPDQQREIELTHVQVFLSELWDRAQEAQKSTQPILHEGLVEEKDNLEGVLDSFLKKQLGQLDADYGKNTALELLAAMISERHTKLQVDEVFLSATLEKNNISLTRPLPELLRDLERRRILRTLKSGEQTQFEISHDVLARVVGQNLTEEMKLRERAREVYRVYEERKGFFSQEDLDLIRPYQQYKAYPPDLEQRIQESEAHLHAEALRMQREQEEQLEEAQRQAEQERQLREESEKQRGIAQENEARARTRTRLALVVSLIALVLALFAGWSYNQAEIALNKVEQEKAATEEQRRIAEAKTREAEANLQLADDNLKKAQAEEARAKAALEQVEKEKAATEEQRKKAEDNYLLAQKATEAAQRDRDKAESALKDLENKNADVVRLILQNADRDILNLRYEDALEKIKAAASLGALKTEVAKHYLEIAFWHGETGNIQRSTQLLDSIATYTQNTAVSARIRQLSADTAAARNRLREAMKLVDAQLFDSLYTKKYYPDMVFVQGGKFTMGCDRAKDADCGSNETPHEQEVSSFRIARTETTVWQFALYSTANGLKYDFLEPTWNDPGDNPVVNVTWFDAVKYANWVSRQKGDKESIDDDVDGKYSMNMQTGYRLPTEAEWEYAAGGGAGTRTKYAGTNEVEQLKDVAWYGNNSGSRTRSVGTRKANPLGLYDMSGNVWEWCWDCYSGYPTNNQPDYKDPETGSYRVNRGGSWDNFPQFCRVSRRDFSTPDGRGNVVGFRLARTP